MSKKHDENKDLRLISRIAFVNYYNKTIEASKNTIIGNKSWGRIDYLTHYCGWIFIYNNSVKTPHLSTGELDNAKSRKREAKKVAKDNTLTNKRNKNGRR